MLCSELLILNKLVKYKLLVHPFDYMIHVIWTPYIYKSMTKLHS
jgi:hypothetical protein